MKKVITIILANVLFASMAFADVFTAGEKVYLNDAALTWWTDFDHATAFFFTEGVDSQWATGELVKVEGRYFSIVVPSKGGITTWGSVIFTRHEALPASWDNRKDQTVDILAAVGNKCYYLEDSWEDGKIKGYWGDYGTGGTTPPNNPDTPTEIATEEDLQKSIVIGVAKPDAWADIYLYYWTDNGTAKFLKPILHEGIYACGFDLEEVNVIFLENNAFSTGTPANEDEAKVKWGKQSMNIEGISESACYVLNDPTYEEGDNDWGKRRVTSAETCPFVTIPEPPEPPIVNGTVSTKTGSAKVWTDNGSLNISVETATPIEIFSLTGKKLIDKTVENTVSIKLQQGIYLLNINGKTYKAVIN